MPLAKVRRIMGQVRNKTNEDAPASLGEIIDWCKANAVPDDHSKVDPHEVYVTAYDITEDSLYIMLTTPFLAGLCAKADCLQTDATFDVMWEKYPLILIGCQDKNRKFFTMSMHLVSQNESGAVYTKVSSYYTNFCFA